MQEKQNNTGLIWFRNNLRTNDNASLRKAIENHSKVIAVYFFDPNFFKVNEFGFKKTAKFRAKFLIETVADLKKNLSNVNITLLTYFENPETNIYKICDAFSVNTVYTQKEWTKEETATNKLIKKTLSKNVTFIEDYDQFLYHPEKFANDCTKIPNVFTVFRKKIEKTVSIEK